MTRDKIRALLFEAGTTDDWQRANAIQCELGHATYADEHNEISTPAAGVSALLDCLFVRLWQTNKESLITMLPAFEIMCGDRSDGRFIA